MLDDSPAHVHAADDICAYYNAEGAASTPLQSVKMLLQDASSVEQQFPILFCGAVKGGHHAGVASFCYQAMSMLDKCNGNGLGNMDHPNIKSLCSTKQATVMAHMQHVSIIHQNMVRGWLAKEVPPHCKVGDASGKHCALLCTRKVVVNIACQYNPLHAFHCFMAHLGRAA